MAYQESGNDSSTQFRLVLGIAAWSLPVVSLFWCMAGIEESPIVISRALLITAALGILFSILGIIACSPRTQISMGIFFSLVNIVVAIWGS